MTTQSNSKMFKVGQYLQARGTLLDKSGGVYLGEGELARVMVYDPEKHANAPYGLRKSDEHITSNYFSEEELMAHPAHPPKISVWTANPAERYDHPDNPRHEELRSVGWKIDPAGL